MRSGDRPRRHLVTSAQWTLPHLTGCVSPKADASVNGVQVHDPNRPKVYRDEVKKSVTRRTRAFPKLPVTYVVGS